jgi:hypothetical protein
MICYMTRQGYSKIQEEGGKRGATGHHGKLGKKLWQRIEQILAMKYERKLRNRTRGRMGGI